MIRSQSLRPKTLCTAGEHLQSLGFPWHFPVLGTYLRCAEAEPFPPTRLPPGIRQAIGRTKRWFFLFSRKWFPVVPFGSREPVGTGSPVPRYRDREPETTHSAVKSFPLFTYRSDCSSSFSRYRLAEVNTSYPRRPFDGVTYFSRTRTSMAIRVLSFLPPARLAAWFFVNSPWCCSITSLTRCIRLVGRKAFCSQRSSSLRRPGVPIVTGTVKLVSWLVAATIGGCDRCIVVVQGTPLPGRDHRPLRVAVLSLPAELSRGRGDDACARCRG